MSSVRGSSLAEFVGEYLTSDDLRRVVLSGAAKGAPGTLRRAVIRPVQVRGERMLQVVTYDERRARTVNVPDPGAQVVTDVLAHPFRHATVLTATEVIEARVTKRQGIVSSRRQVEERPIELAHDRAKDLPVPEDAAFLELLGVSSRGAVKPTRRAKYRQINEFVRHFATMWADAPSQPSGHVLRVLDFGCGNAYLTFAVYYYLTVAQGLPCEVVGIDRDKELVDRSAERAATLGWSGLRFEVGDIESHTPAADTDVVIALHACDTASDHALAKAVRSQAQLILVAPCCHHHLQTQLHRSSLEPAEQLLLRHPAISERVGDVITDVARVTILRLLGYAVDVVEFVSPEHSAKNLLIRANRRSLPVPPALAEGYVELKRRWGVRPLLDELLEELLAVALVHE